MLRIALVDDRQGDRERLRADLFAYGDTRSDVDIVVMCYDDAAQLFEALRIDTFDMVFLDIIMDDMDGIALAQALRERDPELLIVFCTTSVEHAFAAFPVHPFDYLVKPYERTRLYNVMDEALRLLRASVPTIDLRVPRNSFAVPIGKIVAVESRKHWVMVRLTDGTTMRCTMTFTEVKGLLDPFEQFLLVNRGVIVNMDEVRAYEGDFFLMKDDSRYLLRTRGRSGLVAHFSRYTLSRMKGTRS